MIDDVDINYTIDNVIVDWLDAEYPNKCEANIHRLKLMLVQAFKEMQEEEE